MLAFAMQWEGAPGETVPHLALRRQDGSLRLAADPDPEVLAMHGCAGSVAWFGKGDTLAIASLAADVSRSARPVETSSWRSAVRTFVDRAAKARVPPMSGFFSRRIMAQVYSN